MADRITAEERRLIDEHLARRGARRIPRGATGEPEVLTMREVSLREFRLSQARRNHARKAARRAKR